MRSPCRRGLHIVEISRKINSCFVRLVVLALLGGDGIAVAQVPLQELDINPDHLPDSERRWAGMDIAARMSPLGAADNMVFPALILKRPCVPTLSVEFLLIARNIIVCSRQK
jgi:hypothetical protein